MAQNAPNRSFAMPVSPSPFASVKLPAALVQQAREAAQPQRRSIAGQIEYWATLGRIADETGLTVQEAREAIARYDARQQDGALDESLDAIESRFADAETTGRLVQAVRSTVHANRLKADAALPRAA
jgi:ParD-like antitoxin of type II bacterial toxin-antitoxin system